MNKYHLCQRSPPTDPKRALADAVDTVVQRQLACGSGIDWEQVGQAAVLDVRKCLELCRVDEGKERWIYHPDTVSWTPAKRMEAFIADNYPAPAAPNFRAVSNYLWIDMDDCIRMFDVLRGKIVWTDELKAWAVEMRESGMTYPMITRKLTPHPLSPSTIRRLICGYKTPYAPASSELRERVDDFLDNNAKRCTFHELLKLAKVHFEGPEKHGAVVYLTGKAKWHRAYAARLEKVDVSAVYEQVASKKVTRKAMAAQLGVPPMSLNELFASHESKMYSGTWTDVETAKLMEFLDKTSPPHSWTRFSKVIGTKSARQCQSKYRRLVTAGRISQVKE
ncbi:hypothetical protein IWQ57_003328 [Coemansia nantahalensis]|uniref:Uncharacterized protein n=1 Tax=Coemansia nantahalensis TaxID=2789366 RepID=A0ACC1JWM2_9FUNG|nr:hypothetical protein IWQ57_003328 [Coemansia nantahalensis]